MRIAIDLRTIALRLGAIAMLLLAADPQLLRAQTIDWHRHDRPVGRFGGLMAVSAIVRHPSGVLVTLGRDGRVDRSTDAGMTWRRADSGLHRRRMDVSHFGAFAAPTGELYVGGDQVFRSTDAGVSWSEVEGLAATGSTRSIAGTSDGTVYQARWGAGIYRSTDRGVTWSLSNEGLGNLSIHSIAVDSTGIVYAGTEARAFRSTDGGQTWTGMSDTLHLGLQFWFMQVAPDGSVFMGQVYDGGMFRSSDHGVSWTRVGSPGFNVLAISPRGTIYAQGGDRAHMKDPGWRSTDGGASWTRLSDRGLHSVAFGPGDQTIASIENGGLLRSTDDGATWTEIVTRGMQEHVTAIGVDDRRIVYAGSTNGIRASIDGGLSWSASSPDLPTAPVVAIVPGPEGSVLAAYADALYRSRDTASTWRRIALPAPSTITTLASSYGTIVAGTADGRLLQSSDAVEWTELPIGIASPITAVVRTLGGHLVVGSGSNLHYSIDGQSWQRLDGATEGTITALIVDTTGVVYAGTELGLFASDDGGTAWYRVSGDERTRVTALAADFQRGVFASTAIGMRVHARDRPRWQPYEERGRKGLVTVLAGGPRNRIYAGSAGEGFWAGDYTLQWLGVDTEHIGTLPARCTPNPLTDDGRVTLTVHDRGQHTLRVIDAVGRTLASVASEWLEPGERDVVISANGLPDGAHFIEILGPGSRTVLPVVVACRR